MHRPDYLAAIARAKTPEDAATIIRANATRNATGLTMYTSAQRLAIVEQAEHQAQTLERDWSPSGDGVDNARKPWVRWLREWGYPVAEKRPYCGCGAPSCDLCHAPRSTAEACHAPVPGEGQNACTRDRGHVGDHRCKAMDVDDRRDGKPTAQ